MARTGEGDGPDMPRPVMDLAALDALFRREFGAMGDDFTIEDAGAAGVTLRLHVRDVHLRPGRTVSGPAVFAVADVAMYLAVLTLAGPVVRAATTNCAIDFMRRPLADRDIRARARVLKLGHRLAVGDALVYSDGLAAPVARAGLTYSL